MMKSEKCWNEICGRTVPRHHRGASLIGISRRPSRRVSLSRRPSGCVLLFHSTTVSETLLLFPFLDVLRGAFPLSKHFHFWFHLPSWPILINIWVFLKTNGNNTWQEHRCGNLADGSRWESSSAANRYTATRLTLSNANRRKRKRRGGLLWSRQQLSVDGVGVTHTGWERYVRYQFSVDILRDKTLNTLRDAHYQTYTAQYSRCWKHLTLWLRNWKMLLMLTWHTRKMMKTWLEGLLEAKSVGKIGIWMW